MAVRITCINKDGGNHENPHVAIRGMAWVEDGTGKTGWNTREQMYDFIALKGGQAYVLNGVYKAWLIAEKSVYGTKYVKTVPDSTKKDNLLSLKECK